TITPTYTPTLTLTPSATYTPGGPTITPTVISTTAMPTPTNTAIVPSATPTATPIAGVELLINTGFEAKTSDGSPELPPWVLKLGTSDKIKCNKAGKPPVAQAGECAFQFKGSVGENSKLEQTAVITGLAFAAGDALNFGVQADAKDTSVLGKVKVTVKYTDATPKTKASVDFIQTTGYQALSGSTPLASGAVAKIKFSIVHQSPASKVRVDSASLLWFNNGGSLLALPKLMGQG
ncbi:MAG: hypothetical protein H7Y11_15145, partial [Armatimonadetes bacterium]|nr:hypothetical protein [Anaerolineae bacterium]